MIKNIIFQRNFLSFACLVFRWHLSYFLQQSTSPLACGFYITTKCNFRCQFCNIWRIDPPFQMPLLEARKLIGDMGKMGLAYFSFSGGEALLVPYIFDLLASAKESGIIYTHIVSNGYLMDKVKAKELARARVSEISFSLDGDEKIHDSLRCMNGSYKKVFEAVEHVKSYASKTRVVLNTILDPAHPENAVSAIKTAKHLGVKIKVQPLNEHPDFIAGGRQAKSARLLQVEERKKLFNAIDFIQKSSSVVNSRAFLENYKAFLFSQDKLIFAEDECIFGYHHMEIFKNQVFPCLEGSAWEKGFDISEAPIRDIVMSQPYRSKIQELKKCQCCKKNYYICYYEPRMNFPVANFIKSRLMMPRIAAA